MTASNMNKKIITTEKLIAGHIQLLDKVADKISHDYNHNDTRSLASSTALYKAYRNLFSKYDKLDQLVRITLGNSTISKNLISEELKTLEESPEDGLVIEGFELINIGLISLSDQEVHRITIPNQHIPYRGSYYLYIDILPAGQIILVEDNEGRYFGTAKGGKNIIEVECHNCDVCEFILRPIDDPEDENISEQKFVVVSDIKLFHLTDRFINYMNHKISTILQSDVIGNYVKLEEMQIAISEAMNNIRNSIYYDIDTLDDILTAHILEENPHNINPDLIGAAKKNHTHIPESIGAAPISHTHTPESIGASPIAHTHSPEEIGAAGAVHYHPQYALKTDIVETKHIKPCIIVDAPLIDLSGGYSKVDNIPIIILSRQLNHLTEGYLDIVDGVVSSNKNTINNTNLWDGLGNNGYMEFEEGSVYTRTKITYKFHHRRTIGTLALSIILPEGIDYPHSVNIYKDNLFLDNVDLVWTNNKTTVDMNTLTTESFKTITIEFPTAVVINNTWKLNIQMVFNDVNNRMFKIVPGLVYTYENDNAIRMAEVNENITFDLNDMVINHPYFIGLIYDQEEEKHTTCIDALPPYYGPSEEGIQPFVNRYENSNSDNYFGTLNINSDELSISDIIDNDINIHDIYKDSLKSFVTKQDINKVIVSHDFMRELVIKRMTMVFKKNEIDKVPSNIDLKLTDINGNIVNVFNLANYLPDINSDNTYIELDLIISDINTTGYRLELNHTTNIAINQIRIILDAPYYNINRYRWEDSSNKKYIGVIYKRSNGSYDIRPYTLGNVACLPVNGMNLTKNNTRYEIVNPFGVPVLDTEIVDLTPIGGGGILDSSAYIEKITEDKIVINSITSGRYAVHVSRNW